MDSKACPMTNRARDIRHPGLSHRRARTRSALEGKNYAILHNDTRFGLQLAASLGFVGLLLTQLLPPGEGAELLKGVWALPLGGLFTLWVSTAVVGRAFTVVWPIRSGSWLANNGD